MSSTSSRGIKDYRDQLYDTYERFYFHELDRKEKITGRIPILLVIYSFLIGPIVGYLNSWPENGEDILHVMFYTGILGQTAAIVTSVAHTVRLLLLDRQQTPYVQTTRGIDAYVRTLEAHNRTARPSTAIDVDHEVRGFLTEQYCGAATLNFKINKDRYAMFGAAITGIICAAACALVAVVPYFMIKFDTPKTVYSVIIVGDSSMAKQAIQKRTNTQLEERATDKPSKTIPAPSDKPQRPGLLFLRDNETTKQSKARGTGGRW